MKLEAWLTLLEHRHKQAVELGLERCGAVYQRLGSPRPAKQVFTVAGTNGKGSTVAYLAAMSSALGQRCGTYTSPHIFRFNERFSIMGVPVTDDALVRAFEQVEDARDEISLTYFEFTTLAGFILLHQSALDCVVLEVGLGGRLDTVNLVDADCVIITPIGLDHQDYLGPDIDSIAAEKAGVIRCGSPVVCTETHPPGPVLTAAQRLQAPVFRRAVEYDLRGRGESKDRELLFSMGNRELPVPPPAMGGAHQLDNLAAALAALVLFNPDCFAERKKIATAIGDCKVPGRLQQVFNAPRILLDVGHNELAAKAVANYFEESKQTHITCVLAMLADKSAENVAIELGRVCKNWLCAGSPGQRGQSGKDLAQRVIAALPDANVEEFMSVGDAMSKAVSMQNLDQTILVFGSFTTTAAAAAWLKNRMQHGGDDAAKLT